MILAPRYLPRLVATVGLFTRYGLLDFARRQRLLGLEGIDVGKDSADAAASPEKAKEFRERLIELGPAYIKLGQVHAAQLRGLQLDGRVPPRRKNPAG